MNTAKTIMNKITNFEKYFNSFLISERFDPKEYGNYIPSIGNVPWMGDDVYSYSFYSGGDVSHIWVASEIEPGFFKVDFVASAPVRTEYGNITKHSLNVLQKIAGITYNFIKMMQPQKIILIAKNEQLYRIYGKLIVQIAPYLPNYTVRDIDVQGHKARLIERNENRS